MTLHVVFFGKKDSQARKKVYLTAMYISDQATKDVKNIADSIHDYLSLKKPLIEDLYVKSDNAGCYHVAIVPEALFKICKTNNFNLKQYDYNEPCKGKDQCDS